MRIAKASVRFALNKITSKQLLIDRGLVSGFINHEDDKAQRSLKHKKHFTALFKVDKLLKKGTG